MQDLRVVCVVKVGKHAKELAIYVFDSGREARGKFASYKWHDRTLTIA